MIFDTTFKPVVYKYNWLIKYARIRFYMRSEMQNYFKCRILLSHMDCLTAGWSDGVYYSANMKQSGSIPTSSWEEFCF